jgi:hypothetical protein
MKIRNSNIETLNKCQQYIRVPGDQEAGYQGNGISGESKKRKDFQT